MDLHTVEEAEILQAVSRVLQGDPSAFEVIVVRYQERVLRICGSILRSEEDAADAAQEVFYRAFRSLASFRLDKRFTPWIVSIALNTAKSFYRKRGKISERRSSVVPDELPSRQSVEADGVRGYMRERIEAAVARLPERLRGSVILYYLEEMSVGEVAEALGIGKENVKSRLHRARSLLRDFLEKDATEG